MSRNEEIAHSFPSLPLLPCPRSVEVVFHLVFIRNSSQQTCFCQVIILRLSTVHLELPFESLGVWRQQVLWPLLWAVSVPEIPIRITDIEKITPLLESASRILFLLGSSSRKRYHHLLSAFCGLQEKVAYLDILFMECLKIFIKIRNFYCKILNNILKTLLSEYCGKNTFLLTSLSFASTGM